MLCDVYQNRTVKTTHSGAFTDTSPTNTTFTQSLDQLVGKTFDGATITGKAFIHMQVRDNLYSWGGVQLGGGLGRSCQSDIPEFCGTPARY